MNFDQYVDLIKSTAVSTGKKAVMSYLSTRFSFMALPIVNPLVSMFVGYVIEVAIIKTELGAFFLYTDFRVDAQGIEFLEAAARNQQAQQSGNEQEKKDAEQNLMDKFRSFAKFNK